jgi:hypothetical protein
MLQSYATACPVWPSLAMCHLGWRWLFHTRNTGMEAALLVLVVTIVVLTELIARAKE